MESVLKAVNKALISLLKRKSCLNYQSPTDVDQHDDSVEETKKDIESLQTIRKTLEVRISS